MNGFKALLDVCVIVILDDVLVYTRSLEDHVEHIEQVPRILKQHNLYASKKKCEFGASSIGFLGHILTPNGLPCDPIKVETLTSWAVPRTLGQPSGYDRNFINGLLSTDGLSAIFHDSSVRRPQVCTQVG